MRNDVLLLYKVIEKIDAIVYAKDIERYVFVWGTIQGRRNSEGIRIKIMAFLLNHTHSGVGKFRGYPNTKSMCRKDAKGIVGVNIGYMPKVFF